MMKLCTGMSLVRFGNGLTSSLAPAGGSSDDNRVHLMGLKIGILRRDAVWQAGTPKALSGAYAGSGGSRDVGAMLINVLL